MIAQYHLYQLKQTHKITHTWFFQRHLFIQVNIKVSFEWCHIYIWEWVPVLIKQMELGMGYKREKIKTYDTMYFNKMSWTGVVL